MPTRPIEEDDENIELPSFTRENVHMTMDRNVVEVVGCSPATAFIATECALDVMEFMEHHESPDHGVLLSAIACMLAKFPPYAEEYETHDPETFKSYHEDYDPDQS